MAYQSFLLIALQKDPIYAVYPNAEALELDIHECVAAESRGCILERLQEPEKSRIRKVTN